MVPAEKRILVQKGKKSLFFFFFLLQGWFSPGQVFVLDEYCARYGVRGCHRHLCYLTELMEHSENGAVIDPTLLHYSFAFCASHVHGNRYFYLQTHSEMCRINLGREKNVLCHYHLVTDFK